MANGNGSPSGVQLFIAAMSMIAAFGSCGAAFMSYRVNQSTYGENVNYNAIKDSYNIFFDLDRLALENWQLSHLFATPEQYPKAMVSVQESAKSRPDSVAEFQIKEGLIAGRIFDSYEETLFLLDRAQSSGNAERVRFLKLAVDYYQKRLLRNPRLLYLWPLMSGDYEKETRASYDAHVLKDPPLTSSPDSNGPFAVLLSSTKSKTRVK